MGLETRPTGRTTPTPSSGRDISVIAPTVKALSPDTSENTYTFLQGSRFFIISNTAPASIFFRFNSDADFFELESGQILPTIQINEGVDLHYKRVGGGPFTISMVVWG